VASVITRQEYVAGMHKNAVGTNLSYAVVICAELWFAATDRGLARIQFDPEAPAGAVVISARFACRSCALICGNS